MFCQNPRCELHQVSVRNVGSNNYEVLKDGSAPSVVKTVKLEAVKKGRKEMSFCEVCAPVAQLMR